MNRQIKFRAWDKFYEKFQPGDLVRDYILGDFIDDVDTILNQFTGLHDKNGVEIYEGDILEMNGRFFNINFKGEYNFGYILISISDIRNTVMLNANHLKVISVVGNIYENPELLK